MSMVTYCDRLNFVVLDVLGSSVAYTKKVNSGGGLMEREET